MDFTLFPEDFDLLDSDESLDAFDLDLELEDDFLESDFEDQAPSRAMSRISKAARTRRILLGDGSNEEAVVFGFEEGYLSALRDHSVISEDQYGLATATLLAILGKGASLAVKAAKGGALQGRTEGEAAQAGGADFASAFRESSGIKEPIAKRLGSRIGTWWKSRREDGEADSPAEAGPEDLPPVYIADDDAAEEILADDSNTVSDESFGVSDRFGSTWSNSVDTFGRVAGRSAACLAAKYGAARIRRIAPSPESAFVQDTLALPILFGDGKIYEPVYGRLQNLPCPSCSQAHGANGCGVCEGFGAILVPDTDVDALVAGRSHYGAIGLILGIAAAAAAAGGIGALVSNKKFRGRAKAAISGFKKGGKKKGGGSSEIPFAPGASDSDIESEMDDLDGEIPFAPGAGGESPSSEGGGMDDIEGSLDDLESEMGFGSDGVDYQTEAGALIPVSWWR